MIFIPNDDEVSNSNIRKKSKLPLSKAITHKSVIFKYNRNYINK